MDCRSCGVELPRDAVYCLQCGARVELGSVLGVGTDLPPAPPRDQSGADPASASAREQSPGVRAEQDLSETAVLPRLPVTPPARPVPEPQRAAPQPQPHPKSQPRTAQHVDAAAPHSAGTATGHPRSTVLAMVATFVVLTLIGMLALTRIFGSDEPETVATSTTSTATTEGQDAPSESSAAPDASGSTQAEPSPTSAPSESGVRIPPEARRCSTSGSDAVATAYAATERTSCEFAGAVREAYRKVGSPDGATTLRAYSPVTKKWYSLSCDGGAPVRCTSTTNAVVLLAP